MRELTVYADVACPFTHVGLRRIVEERHRRGRDGDIVLVVRAWPLELVNGHPLDPGKIADEIAALRREMVPELFARFDPEQFPATSMPALALTSTAYARSNELGEAAALALRDALFEEGRNVAEADVVASVAAGLGLPAAGDESLALAEYEAGVRLGVVGSPYFVIDESGFFCPALDVSHDEGGFHVDFVAHRFDDFCAQVFA